MVQGSASGVGKSVIATALCRVLREEGFRVAPFKAQNMSNNAAVTADGGEIGRAQAAQAEAAGIEFTVDMNPILLKPEADDRSQLVVRGRVVGSFAARDYWRHRGELWPVVTASLGALRRAHDVVVIEGAGSPAELNLRRSDLANMRVARHASARVILVGDIERGGIFAQLLGTLDLLAPSERHLVAGLLVNKFRGDRTLFDDGARILARRAGVPVLGVLAHDAHLPVPPEDSQNLETAQPASADPNVQVALIGYPRISNFDDVEPLRAAGIDVRLVRSPSELGFPDLIVLPGSKATISDLGWLRASGLATAIVRAVGQGIPVMGICGGLQMLGQRLDDPEGIDGPPGSVPGLDLLPVCTRLAEAKTTRRVRGATQTATALAPIATPIVGYEIHAGVPVSGSPTPFATIRPADGGDEVLDGAVNADGLVFGTYVHGTFHEPNFLRFAVRALGARRGISVESDPAVGADRLAHWFRSGADVQRIVGWIRS